MNATSVSERDLRMLELLARGDSSKDIARKLGYKPGTTRVYMHELYRKLGVANRTAAAAWYFNRYQGPAAVAAAVATNLSSQPDQPPLPAVEESVGDMASRTDLLTALGAMSMFLGPYGKLWQVAARLKGTSLDARLEQRRAQARAVWEALLKGDFAFGKRLFDRGAAANLPADASSDALLLTVLLLLGGYSHAADRVAATLSPGKRASQPGSEHELIRALNDALHTGKKDAVPRLHALASLPVTDPVRQIAAAVLFHVYLMNGDRDHARHVADALWSEAESSRQHLEAMGERTFQRETTFPAPPARTAAHASARREKALAR